MDPQGLSWRHWRLLLKKEQPQPGMLEALGALCPQLLTSAKPCSALLASSKLVT